MINFIKLLNADAKVDTIREVKYIPFLSMTMVLCFTTLLNGQKLLASNESGSSKPMHIYHKTVQAGTQNHGGKATINLEKRQAWMENAIQNLNNNAKVYDAPVIGLEKVELEDLYYLGYRLQGAGKIRFEDGSWIRMMSNSAHHNGEVGDIVLAIDQNGDYYINEGHICGGIINFVCGKKIDLSNSNQFFKNFKCDTDKKEWYTLKHNSNNK